MTTTWIQRENPALLDDSGTTEYRSGLDALIATIADIKQAYPDLPAYEDEVLSAALDRAEERAADLAHRLFERWIEVVPGEE